MQEIPSNRKSVKKNLVRKNILGTMVHETKIRLIDN